MILTQHLRPQVAAFAGVLLLGLAVESHAQDEHPYGQPDPSLSAFSQFAFLRGEWEAAITIISPEGERTLFDEKAHVTAFYLEDGRTVQTCFRTSGFYSTDIRAYDQEASSWRAHFLNATLQRWSGFTSEYQDGDIITLVPGGFSGKESFDTKSVDHDITSDGYTSSVYRRAHGDDEWVLSFELVYRKMPDRASGPSC